MESNKIQIFVKEEIIIELHTIQTQERGNSIWQNFKGIDKAYFKGSLKSLMNTLQRRKTGSE